MAKKILLVEDDLDIQRIYKEKLTLSGFEVTLSADPLAALQLAKQEKPSIVLLDIMLPGKMNGFEMLGELKKDPETHNTPVMILTNLDTEKESALKAGASDYLLKAETNLETLVDKVKELTK